MSEKKTEIEIQVLGVEDSVWIEGADFIIERAFIGEVKEHVILIRNDEEAPSTSRFINLRWRGAPPREVVQVDIHIDGEYYDSPTPIELPPGATVEALILVTFNAELLKEPDPVTGELVSVPVRINMKMLPPR